MEIGCGGTRLHCLLARGIVGSRGLGMPRKEGTGPVVPHTGTGPWRRGSSAVLWHGGCSDGHTEQSRVHGRVAYRVQAERGEKRAGSRHEEARRVS